MRKMIAITMVLLSMGPGYVWTQDEAKASTQPSKDQKQATKNIQIFIQPAQNGGQATIQPEIINLDPLRPIHQQELTPGKVVRIQLINLRPGHTYSIEMNKVNTKIPELSIPTLEVGTHTEDKSSGPCTTLPETLGAQISDANSESDVANAIFDVQFRIAQNNCSQVIKDAIDGIIAYTTQPLYQGIIEAGDHIVVKVSGLIGGEQTFVMTTPRKSLWRTSYGFSFLPNENENWFTRESDTAGEFIITEGNEDDGMDFVPTAMFSWSSIKGKDRDFRCTPVGGLGFDFENPVVLAGLAVTFRENISFNLGAAMHKQKHLSSQYVDLDKPLNTNLEASALLEESYKPNYFVGLSFRFTNNPFKKPAPPVITNTGSGGNEN